MSDTTLHEERLDVPDINDAGLGWCYRVMATIENEPLATAGYELARLMDFALKTQHSDRFNMEVRACVHAFWNRCEREKGISE